MSLNFDLTTIPEDVRLVTATEDDEFNGVKKGDRIMNPVTNALIWATISTGIGVINTHTEAEFAARLSLLQKLDGAMLRSYDDEAPEGQEWSDRPLTLTDVNAHTGLATNVFPYETRAKWLKRIFSRADAFYGVIEPKAAQVQR